MKGQLMQTPKLDPSKPEYPSERQMDTMFNAWKTKGEAGILEVLKALRQKAGDTSPDVAARPGGTLTGEECA
jgi:hypothetical protein